MEQVSVNNIIRCFVLWNESYCYLSALISICEKSMLVELSWKQMVLVLVPLVISGVGCLMATTLQFKLLPMWLWDMANLNKRNYTYFSSIKFVCEKNFWDWIMSIFIYFSCDSGINTYVVPVVLYYSRFNYRPGMEYTP